MGNLVWGFKGTAPRPASEAGNSWVWCSWVGNGYNLNSYEAIGSTASFCRGAFFRRTKKLLEYLIFLLVFAQMTEKPNIFWILKSAEKCTLTETCSVPISPKEAEKKNNTGGKNQNVFKCARAIHTNCFRESRSKGSLFCGWSEKSHLSSFAKAQWDKTLSFDPSNSYGKWPHSRRFIVVKSNYQRFLGKLVKALLSVYNHYLVLCSVSCNFSFWPTIAQSTGNTSGLMLIGFY